MVLFLEVINLKLIGYYWKRNSDQMLKRFIRVQKLWNKSKQNPTSLNKWTTKVYNMVELYEYPATARDRMMRDILFINSRSTLLKIELSERILKQFSMMLSKLYKWKMHLSSPSRILILSIQKL